MNILFLAHRVPYPPNKGDKIRSFNEIKFLSQRHRIDLLCLTDHVNDLQYERELKKYCHSVETVFLSPYRAKLQTLCTLFSKNPLSLSYFFSKNLQALVQQRLRENRFDLIFVYSSSMAQYVQQIQQIQQIPIVMDFVDLDSEKWEQYALQASIPYKYLYRSERTRLQVYERFIATIVQHSFFVSSKEVEDFRKLISPDAPVTAILNGVDPIMFPPTSEPYDSNTLVFTGAMDYWANVQTMVYFATEILPLIKKVKPEVKLYIVGSNPSSQLKRLAAQAVDIIVTGYVDRIQPYLQKAAVFVAPMRIGRGINNKILEAMAMGVPVVTSSLGLEGFPAVPGKDLFVEDDPECFAKQVIQLMTDGELRRTIANNAQELTAQTFSWERNLGVLEQILMRIVK